jgi:hypothetical protein
MGPLLCQTALMRLFAPMADGWRPESIGYIDSEVVAARCHWANSNQESKCDSVLAAVELAWQVQVDEIGFVAPMPDEDGLLDLYITTEGTAGGAYTFGPYEDEDTSDDRMGCHSYVALDSSLSDAYMPAYVVHEFQHVLQFATDFVEPSLPIWEGVASAAEPWTVDTLDVERSYVVDFQQTPWVGILGDGYMLDDDYDIWSYYEYGTAVWILHMDHVYGDGRGSAGRDLWANAVQTSWRNEPDVIDAWDAVTGDWREALMDLSAQRLLIGTEATPSWMSAFSDDRYEVAIDDEVDLTTLPVTLDPSFPPYETGVSYARLVGAQPGQLLSLRVESDEELDLGLVVQDGDTITTLRGSEQQWEVVSGTLVVGIVHLGGADFDGDDTIAPASLQLVVDVGTDDAVAGDSGGDGGGGDDDKKGCGCASASPSRFGLLLLVGVGLVAGLRRSGARRSAAARLR